MLWNHCIKWPHTDVLKVALMSVYKTDMASAAEQRTHSSKKDIPTSFECLTPAVSAQRVIVVHKARAKWM